MFNTSLLGLERFVWLLVCIAFYALAVYWIKGVYDQWQNSPVITSVHTTGRGHKVTFNPIYINSKTHILSVVLVSGGVVYSHEYGFI